MPVLVTDNIQLKIQLSQLRDLLIEELILPCTWRQIGQTDPKQTHSISTATSLPEQIQRFPKEDLIHIQWSVQSPHASMGDKVRVAHLYRHRPRLQPATAQTTTNIFCQVEQRGLQEGDINGVFPKRQLKQIRRHFSQITHGIHPPVMKTRKHNRTDPGQSLHRQGSQKILLLTRSHHGESQRFILV